MLKTKVLKHSLSGLAEWKTVFKANYYVSTGVDMYATILQCKE